MAYELTPWDREWFKRCRRSWDLGSRVRRNLEPITPEWSIDLDRAVRDALAVYYFPGMWEWDRDVVRPLTFQAFGRAMDDQKRRGEEASEITPTQQGEWEEAVATGEALLACYLEWAPSVDRFWPVRVESDFDTQIPDPSHPGRDLVAAGEAIHYRGRIDMLAVDEHDAYWVVRHSVGSGPFTDPDLLALDDEALAACWAWELFYLGMRVAGTIHNELRPGATPPGRSEPVIRPRAPHTWARVRAAARAEAEASPAGPGHRRMYAQAERIPTDVVVEPGGEMFRRTRIPRSRAELDGVGLRLAAEALDMTDPAVSLRPTPLPEHCYGCSYRAPCLAMNRGEDAETILAGDYRLRPPEPVEEGRLGGATWSMNRGAAPPPGWSRRGKPG